MNQWTNNFIEISENLRYTYWSTRLLWMDHIWTLNDQAKNKNILKILSKWIGDVHHNSPVKEISGLN